jgi:hypothetical protein
MAEGRLMLINHDVFLACFGITPADDDDHLIEVTRRATKHGFAIVPIMPGRKEPICTLTVRQAKAADKKAREAAQEAGKRHWERAQHNCGIHHAITDPNAATRIIRRLVSDRGRINLGIEIGLSRMVLVDLDTAEQVEAFYHDWASETGEDTSKMTPTVRTPGAIREDAGGTPQWVHKDGGHVWFAVPEDVDLSTLPGPGTFKAESGWVVFWKDRQALVPPSVRPEGVYHIVGQVELCPEWLLDRIQMAAHSFQERKQQQAARVLHNNDPIDQWAASIDWSEILDPDGWIFTGVPDRCGCPQWTRPGNPAHNKSATAHELGCTRFGTEDRGHGPLHLWTDDPPEFLQDAGKTLTKLQYVAWRDHAGNTAAAMTALGLAALDADGLSRRQRVAEWLKAVAGSSVGKTGDESHNTDIKVSVEENDDAFELLSRRAAQFPERMRQELFRLAEHTLAREAVDTWHRELKLAGLPDPSLTSLTELLSEPDDGPSWRIRGLWPVQGRVVLSAQFKSGKTVMVGNVLRCLVDGDPFLGADKLILPNGPVLSFTVTPLEPGRRVTVIDLELSRTKFREWLALQRIVNTDAVYAETLRGRLGEFDILSSSRRKVWAQKLADIGTTVLIIDPLAPLLTANGIDENDNTSMARLLAALDELCELAGISELLTTHHMGHTGERSRGASRLRDWPDAEWRLVRATDDHGEPEIDAARFFIALGRDVEVPESQLEFDERTKRLRLKGGSRKRHAAARWEPLAREVIKRMPGASGNAIEAQMQIEGASQKPSRNAFKALIARGEIHTYPGPRRAVHHFIGCGCDAPTRCRRAAKAAGLEVEE